MKFIAFSEFCREDTDKVVAKFRSLAEERRKFPDKFPKVVYAAHAMGVGEKTFTVYETDNEGQLLNLTLHYWPELKMEFIPIFPSSTFVESLEKAKK